MNLSKTVVKEYGTCIKHIFISEFIFHNSPEKWFILSSEAKNAYFMSGQATNEIFIFSLDEMK